MDVNICEVIKRNESYVGNIDFEIQPIIVWNSFCILLFSAGQNILYLWNCKSDSDGVFSKTKPSESFNKWNTNLKFDGARHKTHFAWSHHMYYWTVNHTCDWTPHHSKDLLILYSAVPSKNAVSAKIKYIVLDTSIKHLISGQSTAVVKGCIYICLIW